MNTGRKLRFALCIEILLAVFAWAWLAALHHVSWARWYGDPGLWQWQMALCDSFLWMAWAQYMVVGALFLVAWLVWHWPRHILGINLVVCGVIWSVVAFACTGDMTASPAGPMNMPRSITVIPVALLIGLASFIIVPLLVRKPWVLLLLPLPLVLCLNTRHARVGGINWWHVTMPFTSSTRCLVEVVSWQDETIYCRFFKPTLDIDVTRDGYLRLIIWTDDPFCARYNVKQRRFVTETEFRLDNPPSAPKPDGRAADDWGLTNLYNLDPNCDLKWHWVRRVERDFPDE